MNKNIIAGLFIFAIVIWFTYFFTKSNDVKNNTNSIQNKTSNELVTLKGSIWGEKSLFFEDTEVQNILKNKYNLIINSEVKGSISMLDNLDWQDFIFPSNKTVWELMKKRNIPFLKRETIFYSPIVVYSWKDISDVLEKQNIITKTWSWTNFIRTVSLENLANLALENKTWEEIWWDKNYWTIKIFSTNPVESNSWNMFASLLFKIFWWDLNKVKSIFTNMWLLTWSSGTIFKDFLQMQSWMYQLLIWYENQVIEYYNLNENYRQFINDNVIVLYSNPTIYADHELLSLTQNWNRLAIALQDKDILDIAWNKYWFRNIISSENKTQMNWISKTQIKNVTSMPSIEDLQKILDYLK